MTDTPNRPPLWEVMADAFDKAAPAACLYGTKMLSRCKAAEIRALRDWLVPQLPEVGAHVARTMLTAEADRAERS